MKIQLKKALKLNKEEITKLQESQLATIKGGTGEVGDPGESSSGPNCTCKNGTTCTASSPVIGE
jgi:natural product precursor